MIEKGNLNIHTMNLSGSGSIVGRLINNARPQDIHNNNIKKYKESFVGHVKRLNICPRIEMRMKIPENF